VAETLRRLLSLYALGGGDAEARGEAPQLRGLTRGGLYCLLRDAGVALEAGDALCEGEGGERGEGGPEEAAPRELSLEEAVAALSARAQALFRAPGSVGAAAGLPEADAFRLLLQRHVLPLWGRLAGRAPPPPEAHAQRRLRCLARALSPALAAWLRARPHAEGLRAIFEGYAGGGQAALQRRALLDFASDFRIAPGALSREELLSIADMV